MVLSWLQAVALSWLCGLQWLDVFAVAGVSYTLKPPKLGLFHGWAVLTWLAEGP